MATGCWVLESLSRPPFEVYRDVDHFIPRLWNLTLSLGGHKRSGDSPPDFWIVCHVWTVQVRMPSGFDLSIAKPQNCFSSSSSQPTARSGYPTKFFAFEILMPRGGRYYWDVATHTRRLKERYQRYKMESRRRSVTNEEQRIGLCMTSLNQIYTMLQSSPQDWRNYLNLARTVIAHIDSTTFMQKHDRTREQVWMIAGIQRLAFTDADSGGMPDMVSWCSRQWLIINQRESGNPAALRGMGQIWLGRAQPILAKIHRAEGHSSSSTTLSHLSSNDSVSPAEAEHRAGSADYVEARGNLEPATEYFERAIAAATAQHSVSGDLLSTAAEAYMSLGNTSSPRINQQHFKRALQLLHAAASIPGYTLTRYLQSYLDEYGKLLDDA